MMKIKIKYKMKNRKIRKMYLIIFNLLKINKQYNQIKNRMPNNKKQINKIRNNLKVIMIMKILGKI